MTSIVQAAMHILGHAGNYGFPDANTLDVKMDKNILLAPFKRVRGYYLGQILWMNLHKVRIYNNMYTGMMDTCNIHISILTSYFMQYHSCFLPGDS